MADFKIGDEVYIHGFVDEVRRNTVIIKNEGGYFGTVTEEIVPSAQPEQRWIPCSETIDIPEREVLCCDRYGNEIIGYLAYVDEQWLCESDAEMMYDPVAWRKKPEPWRGEVDEQHVR